MTRLPPLLLLALILGTAAPSAAQTEQAQLYERLAQVMAQEQPLAEADVRLYLENAEAIYRLRFEPEKLDETATAISAWTPSRFAYVTTKIAAGMSQLLRADDQRNLDVPEFAKPSPPEVAVIRRAQPELKSTMERLQVKYGTP
ncbi:MAG: hypothetical protein LBC90_08260 [Candidatus Adiutrix sp.]|jgi:hypothetical protein|nr:hypothetical protein [Candidatus Adiutrix sp.]